MNGTLKRLDTAHEQLSTAIRTTDPDLFFKRPSENEWSIAEVVQHLCLAEQHVLKEVGFFKKLIPMRIISWRLVRVKAPKAVSPNNNTRGAALQTDSGDIKEAGREVSRRFTQINADQIRVNLRKSAAE